MTIKSANIDNHNRPRITSVELKPVSYPKFKEDNCLNNGRYLETVFYSLPIHNISTTITKNKYPLRKP